jgi:hypothetical protein
MNELTKEQFREHMAALTIPPGFTGVFEQQSFGHQYNELVFVLSNNAGIEIRFDQSGCGHTRFKIDGRGWLTFDRLGVEDSFYHLPMWQGDTNKLSLNTIVEQQLARIEQNRLHELKAVTVPGIGFRVSPERADQLKIEIKERGHVTFMPSGFGTGYIVAKKPQQGCRFGEKRASQALETFLGHSPLYVCPMDCD